jgi:hypothetical protein
LERLTLCRVGEEENLFHYLTKGSIPGVLDVNNLEADWRNDIQRILRLNIERRSSQRVLEAFDETYQRNLAPLWLEPVFRVSPAVLYEPLRHGRYSLLASILGASATKTTSTHSVKDAPKPESEDEQQNCSAKRLRMDT